MVIRKFKKQDAEEVCKLIIRTFNEFVAPSFTKKGIKNFSKEQTPNKQIERLKTRDAFVAIVGNRIMGVIEGKSNSKITRLFVDKRHQKKGIARNLMNRMEKIYKKRGAKKIVVWSSLYAEEFYKKMGYKKTTRLIKRDGLAYQPMKKIINEQK